MRLAAVAVALACLASLPVGAACIAPEAVPTVPDGATATRDSMLSAQKRLLDYESAVLQYTDCLDRNGGSSAKHDSAVTELRKVAAKFNTELRTFKKRDGV